MGDSVLSLASYARLVISYVGNFVLNIILIVRSQFLSCCQVYTCSYVIWYVNALYYLLDNQVLEFMQRYVTK